VLSTFSILLEFPDHAPLRVWTQHLWTTSTDKTKWHMTWKKITLTSMCKWWIVKLNMSSRMELTHLCLESSIVKPLRSIFKLMMKT
jgi:hypothetical protein